MEFVSALMKPPTNHATMAQRYAERAQQQIEPAKQPKTT
jgi:hypothetical protein